MAGNFLALGGMYAIYKNKENMGKDHLTSTHGQLGASIMICCILLGTAGGVVLHPDFGIDKTNKDVRYVLMTLMQRCLFESCRIIRKCFIVGS